MKNSKRRGEWAELQFMAKAAKFGLWISKPRGELARYDMVIPSQRMRKGGARQYTGYQGGEPSTRSSARLRKKKARPSVGPA